MKQIKECTLIKPTLTPLQN